MALVSGDEEKGGVNMESKQPPKSINCKKCARPTVKLGYGPGRICFHCENMKSEAWLHLPPEIVTLPKIQIRTETEIITVKVTFRIYDDGSIGCDCERL